MFLPPSSLSGFGVPSLAGGAAVPVLVLSACPLKALSLSQRTFGSPTCCSCQGSFHGRRADACLPWSSRLLSLASLLPRGRLLGRQEDMVTVALNICIKKSKMVGQLCWTRFKRSGWFCCSHSMPLSRDVIMRCSSMLKRARTCCTSRLHSCWP